MQQTREYENLTAGSQPCTITPQYANLISTSQPSSTAQQTNLPTVMPNQDQPGDTVPGKRSIIVAGFAKRGLPHIHQVCQL